jgi:hypothetical protein
LRSRIVGNPKSMSPRVRGFVLAAPVGALVCYLAIGHAVHRPVDTAGMHGVGICVVVFAAATLVALPPAPPRPAYPAPAAVADPTFTLLRPPRQSFARASPIWLQRFLN